MLTASEFQVRVALDEIAGKKKNFLDWPGNPVMLVQRYLLLYLWARHTHWTGPSILGLLRLSMCLPTSFSFYFQVEVLHRTIGVKDTAINIKYESACSLVVIGASISFGFDSLWERIL